MNKTLAAFAALLVIGMQGPAQAAFEWKEVRALPVEGQALATAASADGQWLYVLTPGEVLIYALADSRIESRIPIDAAIDQLIYSPTTNSLILSGKTSKVIRVIQLEQVHAFNYEGLAFKGPENAPVTIAVFSDYQWPYCARLEPLLRQVSEKYPKDVRIVFKNYPLPMHQFASKAALAALAAKSQGKFWEYHQKVFENFSALSDAKLLDLARETGLDMKKFADDQRSASHQAIIKRDMNEGNRAGVQGTPTIFVNGKVLENRSLEGFAQQIETQLRKKAK